jgi:DNA-binding winged helix-turn-helix (wHTH) protein/TolB-like protein/Tfp pilus assembly protein PilF
MRLTFGDVTIDCERRQVTRGGEEVHLSGKAFALLELLLQHRPNAVKRQEIFAQVWAGTFVSPSNLATLAQEIREALGDDARRPRFLKTIFGYGYAFIGEEGQAVRSVAVLPFRFAGGAEAGYVSDGITESLIDTLAEDAGIRVMARSTVFRFRDSPLTPQQVGRELHVDAVVTADLQQRGDALGGTLVLAAELVSVHDGARLWGARYERSASDLMAIEHDLAEGVVRALQLDRLPRGQAAGPKRDEAHALYLRAQYAMNERTAPSIRAAAEDFGRAIDADPSYAPPYAALAGTYTLAARYADVQTEELAARAREAAERALQLDPELPEAHVSLASVYDTCDWNWFAAEEEYRKAIALRPGDVLAHQWYGLLLTRLGRAEEGREQLRIALRLDPLSPRLHLSAANVEYYAGQYDDAANFCAKAIALDPAFPFAHLQLALILLQQRRHDAARDSLASSGASAAAVAARAVLDVREGNVAAAEALMSQLTARGADYELAVVAAALGRHDAALDALERACARRNVYAGYAAVDPLLEALKDEPRFRAALS